MIFRIKYSLKIIFSFVKDITLAGLFGVPGVRLLCPGWGIDRPAWPLFPSDVHRGPLEPAPDPVRSAEVITNMLPKLVLFIE